MQEILSVTELTAAIKKQLESRFLSLSVKGEISNLKEQTSGHLYFTLKDQDAQISAVLFRGNAKDLNRLPKNGDQVILRGEINVYAPRGTYQIVARKLEFLGVGELLLKLHALKSKLEKQGWFEASRKKPLPKFPRTIGVVTSPTGSVIQDILHVLSRRFSGFHLILNPVKVQGDGAAEDVAKAIEEFNRYPGLVDVLIVGRGGGSLEDLWAFNEERVASAIYHSKIPVISAIGHETDFSIADFVADVRAPTPSAAAEIATTEKDHQLQFLSQSKNRLKRNLLSLLEHHKLQTSNFKRHPCLANPLLILEPHLQRIDDLRFDLQTCIKRVFEEKQLKLLVLKKQSLALKPSQQLAIWKQKLAALSKSIQTAVLQKHASNKKIFDVNTWRKSIDLRILDQISQKKQKLGRLSSHLQAIDPANLLKKGYCILFQEKKESVILSSRELNEQQKVRLQLHDGIAHLTVDGIES